MTDGPVHNPAPLVCLVGRRAAPLLAMLLASLVCNITALTLPFMELRHVLHGTADYSLFYSVKLMWSEGLHLVAVLIVGFSVIFPFFKLGVLTAVWFVIRQPRVRGKWLLWVEVLGRWSFLDIFVVVIVLVLSNKQWLVGAHPMPGVYFFVTAITLSMLCSMFTEWILPPPPESPPESSPEVSPRATGVGRSSSRENSSVRPSPAPRPLKDPLWARLAMPVLLLVTIMALVAAVGLPFLQIDQFMLKHRSYSVIRSAEALWESGAYVLVSVVVGGLMVMPGLQWFGMVMAWCLRRAPAQRLRWQQAATAFGRWAMLDVFALALFLFLTEGETLIKTEVKTGLYMVVVTATAALAVAQVARLLGGRVARSAEG